MTSSPVTQNDGHQSAAREAGREEPARVRNVDQGPNHDHGTPKQAQPTFHGNSVNSDSRMYSHRQYLQGGTAATKCGFFAQFTLSEANGLRMICHPERRICFSSRAAKKLTLLEN